MARDLTTHSDGLFLAAVEAIYDTAAAPQRWSEALDAIAAVFGDVGANLTYQRDDGRFGVIISQALLPGQDEYIRDWSHQDIRAIRLQERGSLLWQDVVVDQDILSDTELSTHPFYTKFLAAHGLRWFAVTGISPDPHVAVGISVQRASTKEPFTSEERAHLFRLGRHAEKALRLSLRLIDGDVANVGLREAIGRLGVGVFLLDGLGRVVLQNVAAEHLVGEDFAIAGERLTAQFSGDREKFDAEVDAMSKATAADLDHRTKPLLLSSRGSQKRRVVYVLPLRQSNHQIADDLVLRSRVLVLVMDAGTSEAVEPTLIRDLLGLTLGEARLASLVGTGMSPRDASKRLGISEATARTVLKRVFAKADVSRQSELAAVLAKLALGDKS